MIIDGLDEMGFGRCHVVSLELDLLDILFNGLLW